MVFSPKEPGGVMSPVWSKKMSLSGARRVLLSQAVPFSRLSEGVSSGAPVLLQEVLQVGPLVLLQLVPLVEFILGVQLDLSQ